MGKVINSADSAITDALAGMAAARPSRIIGVERLKLTRPQDAPVRIPALRWER